MRGKMCGRSESKGGKPMFRRRSLSHGCSSCESCSSGPFKRAAAFRFSYIEVYYSIFKSVFMPKKSIFFCNNHAIRPVFIAWIVAAAAFVVNFANLKHKTDLKNFFSPSLLTFDCYQSSFRAELICWKTPHVSVVRLGLLLLFLCVITFLGQ